jgi:hypothetical protein
MPLMLPLYSGALIGSRVRLEQILQTTEARAGQVAVMGGIG